MQQGIVGARRSGLEIIASILMEARNGVTKTRLIYRTNMNFIVIRKYMDFLNQKGLMAVEHDYLQIYTTTEKGLEFLNEYAKIKETLGIDKDEFQ